MTFCKLPYRLQVYVVAHVLAVAPAGWVFAQLPSPVNPALATTLVLLTALVATWKVELTAFQGRMTPVFSLVCMALLLQGSQTAVACAAVGALVTTVVRSPQGGWRVQLQRQPLHQILFNPAHCGIVCLLASLVFGVTTPMSPPGDLGRIAALSLFTAVYFLCNSAGISLAIALKQGKSPWNIWREHFLWTSPNFFVSALAAAVVWLGFRSVGAWSLAFIAPLYLLYYSYWLYLDRLRQANAKLTEEIAERQRAEATLKQERELLQAVLESVADGIIAYDTAGIPIHLNRAARSLVDADALGTPLSEWPERLGLRYENGPRSGAGSRVELQPTTPGAERRNLELRWPGPDEADRVVLASTQSIPTSPDERLAGVLVLHDISDRRRADLAQYHDRRKNEFLAMLGHELRNPLAPILNAVTVLRRRGANDPQAQRFHEIIERQARHLARLVDDLLDINRITRGTVELRKEDLILRDLVENSVQTSQPHIRGRCHQLTVRLPEERVWLHGDATRLAQVISNLLNNASKYTEPGGRIWLEAKVEGEGERLEIRIRDTGRGIPREMLPQIFDLFTQVDTTIDRSMGGLGIGLTLVKQLIEMHGGMVTAHSDGPGHGAEFTLRLPILRVERSAATDPYFIQCEGAGEVIGDRVTALDRNASRRVLLVEDNRDSAEVMREMLELWGYQVRHAADGEAALTAAAEFAPELVLLDIGLPGLDGYEVARRLQTVPAPAAQTVGRRSSHASCAVAAKPVLVALTGYGGVEDRQRAREAGFDHHLTKPVDPEKLRSLIGALTG